MTAPDFREALEAHRVRSMSRDRVTCECGVGGLMAWPEHRAHVAQALAADPGVRAAVEREAGTLPLADVQRIVDHLINDGTRDGLILGDLLNKSQGASARRRRQEPSNG